MTESTPKESRVASCYAERAWPDEWASAGTPIFDSLKAEQEAPPKPGRRADLVTLILIGAALLVVVALAFTRTAA